MTVQAPITPIAPNEESPIIISHEEVSLSPFKFESDPGKNDDIWAFYRCLMRGFLLATYEQELETINANPSKNKDEADNNKLIIIGRIGRLLRGMNKTVLHVDNVFQFDDFAITECDLIVGMLTRISRWFKHKVQLDVPRQYFSDIDTSKIALESSADYFVHQIDLAFKDLKHKKPDPTISPIVVKDIDDFIVQLTSDMNNVGRSKVLAAYDAVRGSITTEKARAVAGKVTRKVRLVVDKTKQVGNTAVEGVKKFTRGRQLAFREWDANRQREKAEKADQALAEIKAKQLQNVQSGGAPSKKGLDLMYPLKQYRELRRATGEIEVMQKPNMTAVEYFEKLPVMLTRTSDNGDDQVFPALFGHPLLLYLPFARAFGCIIEVYSRSSLVATDPPVLKYLFPSEAEIAKSAIRNMPVIRIMDDNPYNADPNLKDVLEYPNFLTHQDQYIANFSILFTATGKDVADKAVEYLANKVKMSTQMKSNGEKMQRFEDQYNIADAKYKDAESLMVKTKEPKENAREEYKVAKEKYEDDTKNPLPANADAKMQSARNDNRRDYIKTRKRFIKAWEVYNTAITARNATFKRRLVTQNRLKDMISNINSQKDESDKTADKARQTVINMLSAYKVPTPYVKQTKPVQPPAPAPVPVLTSGQVTSTAPSVLTPAQPVPPSAKPSAPAPAVITPVISPSVAPPAPAKEPPAPVVIPAPAKPSAPVVIPAPAKPSAPVAQAPPAPVKTVAPAPPAPVIVAPSKPSAASSSKPASSLKLKIMTFNVCWEALSAKNKLGKHCLGPSNPCAGNIKSAILDKISQGTHVILLQEGIKGLGDFFSGAGVVSDTVTKNKNILQYIPNPSNPDPISSFFVYTFTSLSETIVTMCSKTMFPDIADIYFMGNLASESINLTTMANEFLPSVASDGDFNRTNNIIGGARPYIVLVFRSKNLILINIHAPHATSFEPQQKPDPVDPKKKITDPDPEKQKRVDALNKQHKNLQEYAFTKLGELLRKRIPNFDTYNIIIGGDFNNKNPLGSGLFGPSKLNINPIANPIPNIIPTLSGDEMKTYTTVSDHIYSNKLNVVEYKVHDVETAPAVKKNADGKFLFSDHLPVYATIEMPS